MCVGLHFPLLFLCLPFRAKKKSKPLNLKIHSSVGSCENIPSQQRSPLLSERSLRSFFVGHAPFLPSTPPVHTEVNFSANTLSVPRWSPQIPRRDLGNSIKHRFSTKYWMSQTCTVCGKGMLFGLKCKNCKLKCHNKCTKEAPPCHLLIIHRGARLVRTESVPCDINNPLRKPPRYSDLHISQTLPKTNKINKDHIPVPYQPDSSSNPSSTTSSTPSSPAPPLPPSATPPSPLHPSPQCTRQQKNFNLPDVVPVPETPTRAPQVILHPVTSNPILEGNPLLQIEVEPTSENEEGHDEAEESEDDFEEMNLSLLSARSFPRKASQTSIFLQEWDIPFEQLEIGELIGKGRFGQVYHGRWHGEVAIRLIDIERDNEEQLKAFKREVMAYRQTRHENVVLFMGACMSPPHLAIITSLCKGRTLYSVVRDAKIVLDVNKTRQIAQEIVKGLGVSARGLVLLGLSNRAHSVLCFSRRDDKLRIQNGWLCHLAPEIIRQLSPDTEEDKLPFSKHSDVFALGTIWYELHAREWPFKTQPAEAIIWQMGTGMKPNLSQIGMGKEISDILLFCWAFEQEERPTFTKLMDMLEKLPKRNRRLSHPGHFWKSAE
uniref:Kinase suppressor of Ras 2 n=1 Tax=Sus scrofa TaxID=9823 RepID=A0A8D0X2F5_PIG